MKCILEYYFDDYNKVPVPPRPRTLPDPRGNVCRSPRKCSYVDTQTIKSVKTSLPRHHESSPPDPGESLSKPPEKIQKKHYKSDSLLELPKHETHAIFQEHRKSGDRKIA